MILQYYHKAVSIISMMRHPRSCFLCFFDSHYKFPLSIHSIIYLLVSDVFFTCFAVVEESIQARTVRVNEEKYDLLPCIPIVPLYIQIGSITVAEIMYAK